jgi:hypothetical protein
MWVPFGCEDATPADAFKSKPEPSYPREQVDEAKVGLAGFTRTEPTIGGILERLKGQPRHFGCAVFVTICSARRNRKECLGFIQSKSGLLSQPAEFCPFSGSHNCTRIILWVNFCQTDIFRPYKQLNVLCLF